MNAFVWIPEYSGEQQSMTWFPLGNLVRSLTRLKTQIHHNILHGLIKGLEWQTIRVLKFILLAKFFPSSGKISLHDSLNVVCNGNVKILQLILIIVSYIQSWSPELSDFSRTKRLAIRIPTIITMLKWDYVHVISQKSLSPQV